MTEEEKLELETLRREKQQRLQQERARAALEKYMGLETLTKDGEKVQLFANIGTPEDASQVIAYDGEGVGLFRTEFLFMDRSSMPD